MRVGQLCTDAQPRRRAFAPALFYVIVYCRPAGAHNQLPVTCVYLIWYVMYSHLFFRLSIPYPKTVSVSLVYMRAFVLLLATVGLRALSTDAYDNGLGRLPPMGKGLLFFLHLLAPRIRSHALSM